MRFDSFIFTNLPKGYIDPKRIISISQAIAEASSCVVRGTITGINITDHPRKTFVAYIHDGTSSLKIIFYSFNNYHRISFRKGFVITLSGRVKNGEMAHPAIIPGDKLGDIKPVYGNDKVRVSKIKKCIAELSEDPLPFDVREKRGIPDLQETARMLHFPKDMFEVDLARWSMAYRELFVELSHTLEKEFVQKEPFNVDRGAVENFTKTFPFTLTADQNNAAADIIRDMESDSPMKRVLIGDVGSGKTEVAICAIIAALSAGYRALYLCPTEILAVQTYHRVAKSLSGKAYVALYTANEKVTRANPDVYVGTHALLHNNWTLHKVGLVIVDEQHKFGVKQREKLIIAPECNLLEMSATPIPRTYALFVQNIMDVSIINEVPYKKNVETELIVEKKHYERALKTVEGEIEKGKQALIIYPSIESERGGIKPAVKAYEYWAKQYGESVGLLHGKIKEKESILRRFNRGDIRVLVSTSATEVGIDVPDLTACVVVNAERFGLVQLHQIRGRAGRRGDKAYFFMICKNDNSIERLKSLVDIDNGFDLADIDARSRGVGHLSGNAQSGHYFQFFSIKDIEIVNLVKEDLGLIFEEAA